MGELEEAGDSIEDIKKAMKSLEERHLYDPQNGKFKVSKELYNYLMGYLKKSSMKCEND